MQKVIFINPDSSRDTSNLNQLLSKGWKVINMTSGTYTACTTMPYHELKGSPIFAFVLEKD